MLKGSRLLCFFVVKKLKKINLYNQTFLVSILKFKMERKKVVDNSSQLVRELGLDD